ncbi:hypothetical protein JCM3774_006570 [Rhodotorula dairenensis]
MATSFLGLPVLVKLRTGSSDSVQGILSSLDPASGTLTLTEARSFVGGVNRLEGIRVLSRSEVAGLELLSVQRGDELEAHDSRPSSSAPRPAPQRTQLHRSSDQLPSPVPSPARLSLAERTPSGRSQKRKQQANRAVPSPRASAQHSPQPSSRIDGDFDFSAGLASFDKKAIFADIKSQDATDPSSRLHAHNRNPSSRARTPQSKLLPSESVLSPQELYNQQQEVQTLRDNRRTKIASMTPTDMHAGDVEESLGGGAEGEDQRNERRWQNVTDRIERIALSFSNGGSDTGAEGEQILTASGRAVPVVKGKQWREALSIAEIESSLSTTQRLEASSSALLLHVVSQRLVPLPVVKSDARPTLCVLASDSDRGYIALRAAATLAYRGCRVAVLAQYSGVAASSPDSAMSERFRTAIRVISSAGARIIREVEDLPQTCTLVIDALDSLAGPGDGEALQPSIDWANSLQGAYLLALDVPSGVDPETGNVLPSIKAPLLPNGVLAYGLPRPCLATDLPYHPSSSGRHGGRAPTITLADVGFPPAIWDRVGVEGYDAQIWGTELLVELERSPAL